MTIYPPLKKAPYEFSSLSELRKLIGRQGQFFGEDKSGPACNYEPSYPCDKTLYQHLGLVGHNGLDIPCNDGEPILASHDGVVVEVSDDESAGLGIVLWDEKQLIKTVYWHLKAVPVKVGDRFKAGDVLAPADNTGLSSGTHLHFSLKQTNQYGTTLNWDNGYYGAIDPWPYMVWFDDMKLTKIQVIRLYKLSFYRAPDDSELLFWTGKDLSEFLETAIKDRAKFLADEIS